jgi:hypothetical protein
MECIRATSHDLALFSVAMKCYPLGREKVLELGETLDVLHREK